MGGTSNTNGIDLAAISAADYTMRTEFWQPPEEFDGCFTSFYQFDLDVPSGGRVHDYLQPEWANLRFFAGEAPHSELAEYSVVDARFSVTGPTS
ncbi:MAG: hypothetical protein ABJG26_03420, partial [Marinomonas sp.]